MILRLDLFEEKFKKIFISGNTVTARVYKRLSPYEAWINIKGMILLARSKKPIREKASYRIHRDADGLFLKAEDSSENFKKNQGGLWEA